MLRVICCELVGVIDYDNLRRNWGQFGERDRGNLESFAFRYRRRLSGLGLSLWLVLNMVIGIIINGQEDDV